MTVHVLLTNGGNDSLAMLQWAHEVQLPNVTVVTVDTGWSAPGWSHHMEHVLAYAQQVGFATQVLRPTLAFPELIRERQEFPSTQFQWCAGFLKGLPLLAWLDQPLQDPDAKACIMIAHRRSASKARFQLPERIEDSEHFGGREVWYPLVHHTTEACQALVQRAGFAWLAHRSLECDPCVNSDEADVLRMSESVRERTARLEQELQQRMLDPEIYQGTRDLQEAYRKLTQRQDIAALGELFDMGCGAPYGCGL